MSCGLTALVSRIKLAWFVARNPDWRCSPWCVTCEYFEICKESYLAEEGYEEIIGEPVE